MNALSELLRQRKEQLLDRGETVRSIAARGGIAESTVYEHLKRRDPNVTMPLPETLERLAAAFQLDLADVYEAARASIGPITGNPLQILIRSRQLELGRTNRDAAKRARKAKHPISEATISEILTGVRTKITDGTVAALAAGFDLDPTAVQAAADQSSAGRQYRLPRHIEEQLTPERWAAVVKIVEATLKLGDS